MKRRMVVLLVLLLAACNLQQQGPPNSPTAAPNDETPLIAVTNTSPPPALPTLQPTPIQLILTTATSLFAPTPLNVNGNAVPTLDAALADERYELQVRPNATVGINYEVTLTRGTVVMSLQGPDGLIWQKTFTITEKGRDEIAITQGGTYEILVTRERFDGNYALSWD